jgi:hypothetical protein
MVRFTSRPSFSYSMSIQSLFGTSKRKLSFLIFACPKSGTTWMQKLLSAHPQVICTESRPFGDYYNANPLSMPHLSVEKFVSILSHYFNPTIPELSPQATAFQRKILFSWLDHLADATLEATGKKIYGEKLTPFRGVAGQVVERLHEYNPDVKFVNLVRDGRDVIVSGAAQWLNLRIRRATSEEKPSFEQALKNHVILEEDFNMFVESWTDSARAALTARSLFKNYLHLSYEKFVADPQIEAKRLLQFIGANADSGTVRTCVEGSSFKQLSGGREPGEENPGHFFRKGVVGDWKNWFNDQQKQQFEAAAGPLMKEMGYKLD